MESILASNPAYRSRPIGFNSYVCEHRLTVEASINQSTDQSTSHANAESVDPSVNQSIANELVKRWHALSDCERERYRIEEEKNAAVLAVADFSQSNKQSTNQSNDQSTSQETSQSTSQSNGHSINQDDEEEYYINTKDQSIHSKRDDSSANQSADQSIGQSLQYNPLDLNNIRETLIRLEESIIFALIERAQFKLNRVIYQSINQSNNPFGETFNGLSFMHYFLYETERLHSKIRRYTSPDEHPFCHPSLFPKPILPPLIYPQTLKQQSINFNASIDAWYEVDVLPAICSEGDDGNYGSSALADITCLQLLSKRIHYGKFVAEAKFRMETAEFSQAIKAGDTTKLMQLITKPVVEEQVIQRVHRKAMTYGTTPDLNASPDVRPVDNNIPLQTLSLNPSTNPPTNQSISTSQLNWSVVAQQAQDHPTNKSKYKISPAVIAQIYLNIIELNKQVQIQYLLQRLE